MIGEPLVSDGRLGEIEAKCRQANPGLPEAARFVTYLQPPTEGMRNGVVVPVNQPVAVAAVVIPDPRRDSRERWVRGSRWLQHFQHFENQRDRIVGAPDVLLDDFLQIARRAAQMYQDSVELARV